LEEIKSSCQLGWRNWKKLKKGKTGPKKKRANQYLFGVGGVFGFVLGVGNESHLLNPQEEGKSREAV